VKVVNDLLMASGQCSASVLMLLDLSATFDTINHHIHLERLETLIGLHTDKFLPGLNLICQKYILSSLDGLSSEKSIASFGVPQGSV
jgi:hypothetical protein